MAEVLGRLSDGVVGLDEANAQGHLFKQVSVKDVAEAASAKGAPLPESAITIATPIKSVGAHMVKVLQGTVKGELVVNVVAR